MIELWAREGKSSGYSHPPAKAPGGLRPVCVSKDGEINPYHVGVAIQGVDMLGDFLDWVSGEHTEATANDSAEKQLLLNNQKSKERSTQPSSPTVVSRLRPAAFLYC